MNILDHAKEILELVKKHNDQDLYERVFKLREEILELCEENLRLRGQATLPKEAEIGVEDAKKSNQTDSTLKISTENVQRQCVLDALAKSHGQIAPAARLLGVSRPTLYEKIKRFGIGTHATAQTKTRNKIEARLARQNESQAVTVSDPPDETFVNSAQFWFKRAVVLCRAGLLKDAQSAIGICFEINPDLKIAALGDPNLAAIFQPKPNSDTAKIPCTLDTAPVAG